MAKRAVSPEATGSEVAAEAVSEATLVAENNTRFDEFVEHEKKAVQEFGKAFMALLPEGAREHGEAAIKEMIEGYRRLFNATLDDIVQKIEGIKLDDKPVDKN